jgi:Na+-transporting NADH:ubiquinone oxidoreductase subunit A
MAEHVIRKGLSLPISGRPSDQVSDGGAVTHVAVVGHDYPTMKPRMHVEVGDSVKRGQLLFEDRKSEGVRFTAPGAGEVVAIHRGERRKFLSLVIELSATEKSGDLTADDHMTFPSFTGAAVNSLSGEQVRALVSESGLWTAIRQRPFDRVPSSSESCAAIFVTAVDTNPLAGSVEAMVAGQEEALRDGLQGLSLLTDGPVYLCVGPQWKVDVGSVPRLQKEIFSGKHPAGLVGTHIHTLCPVSRKRTAWHLGVQDVIAMGHLLKTGKLDVNRVVAFSGPAVTEPRLLRTRLGASTTELTAGGLKDSVNEPRLLSGSVIFGQTAQDETVGYLNRYDAQLTALSEDRERKFLGWLAPGTGIYSTINAFISSLMPNKSFDMTTTTHGSHRAMVPIGMFERVMPLDIMPTFLLRSLLVGDIERSEELGCLELNEEDLALCSFVSPGKEDYGKALRKVLTDIWQEG